MSINYNTSEYDKKYIEWLKEENRRLAEQLRWHEYEEEKPTKSCEYLTYCNGEFLIQRWLTYDGFEFKIDFWKELTNPHKKKETDER